jgi:hypothetical protein
MGQYSHLSRLSFPDYFRQLARFLIVLLIPIPVFTQQPAGNTTGNDSSGLLYNQAMEGRFTDSTLAIEPAIEMPQLATEQAIASERADAHYSLGISYMITITIMRRYGNLKRAITFICWPAIRAEL